MAEALRRSFVLVGNSFNKRIQIYSPDFVHSSRFCCGAWRPERELCQVARYGGTFGSVSRLRKLCNEGRLDEALQTVELMDQRGIPISRDIVWRLLQGCTKTEDLAAGRRVRSLMVSSGLDSIAVLGDHLIRLFALCGSLLEANQVFCKVAKPSVYTWSAIISAYAKRGQGQRALELYYRMQQSGVKSNEYVYVAVLHACASTGAITQGRLIHAQIIESGLETDVVVGSTLVDMYAKCVILEEAHKVFDKMPNRNVVSWGAMIAGYAQHGHGLAALELFKKMQLEGIKPNKATILSILKACGSIGAITQGRMIHDEVIKIGFELDMAIGSTLVDMYAKCGCLEEACKVFNKLPNRDVVSWGVMIAGFAQHGHGLPAIELFKKMEQEGIKPNRVIFLSILKACGSIGAIEQGRLIHDQIIKSRLELDVVIGSTLVDMYAKCGSLDEASIVFYKLPNRDVVSWGAMIAGYAQHGHGLVALDFFEKMQQEGIYPDKGTFLSILKACSSIQAREQGRMIHDEIIKNRLESDLVVGNTLVDMYAKCGVLEEARKVFDNLPNRDVVSWGAMLAGYAQHGHGPAALELFEKMQQEGIKPDKVIFLSILKACGSIGTIDQGRLIHDQIIGSALELDLVVGNTLVDMYAKCGSLQDACKVFDALPSRDVVSWGAMIAGYVQHGHGLSAVEHFHKMQQDGIKPDNVTFSSILKACASIGAIEQGRLIHDEVIKGGLESDLVVGNTLVDMYAKCGSLGEACKVFNKLPKRDVVSWGAMIAGYTQYGHGLPALELFEKMQQEGIEPNKVIYSSILKACGSIGAIEQGRLIHDQIIKSGLESDVIVGNTLIDMYAKCGSLEQAYKVFNTLPNRDVVSWGAMITGYARYGNSRLARQCLVDMQQQGLKPDGVIFTSILAACSHAGLVDEGCQFFKSMREDHGITPSIEHYNCMVDLLGRAGRLNEAEDLLQTMPIPPNIIGWNSLLTACRTYGNMELGRLCFDQVVRLDPTEAAGYVLMSNIYADAHMWEDVDKIQQLRKCAGAQKKPGRAWIEVDSKVHEFIVGDKSHPHSDEIYAKLNRLSRLMKEEGYVPQLNLVLQPMSDEDKEDALCGHCEKLAIAFGLVNIPRGRTMRVTKNLRVCTDCHNGTKIISKIERRDIIIRDAYRIHHFKDGACSCGDYY